MKCWPFQEGTDVTSVYLYLWFNSRWCSLETSEGFTHTLFTLPLRQVNQPLSVFPRSAVIEGSALLLHTQTHTLSVGSHTLRSPSPCWPSCCALCWLSALTVGDASLPYMLISQRSRPVNWKHTHTVTLTAAQALANASTTNKQTNKDRNE